MRHFKAKLADGKFIQNRRKITSAEKLYEMLDGYDVAALYHSCAYYLNSQLVRGNLVSSKETLFLFSNFLIDLDAIGNDLEQCRKDALKIIKALKGSKYGLKAVNFSGRAGLHLVYALKYKPRIKDIEARFNFYKEETSRFQAQIAKLKLKTYDYKVTEIFRVYACPYSFKSNGNMVTPLTKKELTQNLYTLLTSKSIVLSEPNGNDGVFRPLKRHGKDRAEVRSFHFKYLDNMVNGTKANYITLLEHYNFMPKLLKEIQAKYKLSDFYVFEIGKRIYSLNLKCVSFEREMKILKAAKSLNLNTMAGRKHIPIIITAIKDNNNKMASMIKFEGIIKSPYGLKDIHSRPHCNFFGVKYENMSGVEKQMTYERVEKNGKHG